MKKIDTLSFYDFDDTIIHAITPKVGKTLWKEKMDTNIDIEDESKWWDDPKSLDVRVFEFKPFKEMVDKIKEDNLKANCKTILLTNRKEHLSGLVKRILDKFSLKFDIYKFKNDDEKVKRIIDVLKLNPNIKNINIYDDRNDEIFKFKAFQNKYKDKYNINVIQHKPDSGMNLKEMIKEEVNENLSKSISIKKIKELAFDITKRTDETYKKIVDHITTYLENLGFKIY